MSDTISTRVVAEIAQLAHIPISDQEQTSLADAFTQTLATITNLQAINVSKIAPTHQVTGLENVTRDDIVDHKAMFNQEEALANAKSKHEGYFVVEKVLHKSDTSS